MTQNTNVDDIFNKNTFFACLHNKTINYQLIYYKRLIFIHKINDFLLQVAGKTIMAAIM